MITGLDRTTLLVRDLDAGVAAYRKILAREPTLLAADDGVDSALFVLDNMTLRLASPQASGARGEIARAHLQAHGAGLVELVFRVGDIERSYRRLKRLSLLPGAISEVVEQDAATSRQLSRRRTVLPPTFSNGLDLSLRDPEPAWPLSAKTESSVLGVDLVVVNTGSAEQAMALYGAQLGLALIFDQTNAKTGNRLLQFACGDMVVEVVHKPGESGMQRPDRLWGIGWSVPKAEDARERLARAGLDVSDVKDGAKPGTRVFTIRDGTCNVPTLVVQHLPDRS